MEKKVEEEGRPKKRMKGERQKSRYEKGVEERWRVNKRDFQRGGGKRELFND